MLAASYVGVPTLLLLHILVWGVGLSMLSSLDAAYYRAGVACGSSVRPSSAWSGSAHCGDRQTVLAVGTQAASNLKSVWLTVHLLTAPLLGALADHHGRVRTILFCVALLSISEGAAAIAAWVAFSGSQPDVSAAATGYLILPWPLLLVHVLCGGISAPAAAVSALCNDFCPPDQRPPMYTYLAALHGVAGTAGLLVGTRVLNMNVEQYAPAYAALTLLLAAAAVPLCYVAEPTHLRELLSGGGSSGSSSSGGGSSGGSSRSTAGGGSFVREHAHSAAVRKVRRRGAWDEFVELNLSLWRLSRRSRFLQLFSVATALEVGGMAGYGNLLAPMSLATRDWAQGRYEQLLLMTALPTCIVAVAVSNRYLFGRFGAAGVMRLAQLFLLAGHAALVTMPWLGEPSVYLGGALLGLAGGAIPAFGVLLADRFPANELAQVHALVSSCVSLAVIVAVPAFANAFNGSTEPSMLLPVASFVIALGGAALALVALAMPPEAAHYRRLEDAAGGSKAEALL